MFLSELDAPQAIGIFIAVNKKVNGAKELKQIIILLLRLPYA
jgi:hypothetical protein